MSHSNQPPEGMIGSLRPEPKWRQAFRRRLLNWFGKHRRDLPWRETSDAYRVWVSEIMLQQTQVATVIPYYEQFLIAFPDVHALAAADEQEVLRRWEGLGYYRRARQLHRAAKVVASEHGGRFPDTVDGLMRLPGVGRYTAGAIASIAHDLPAPILEANTIRLFSRLSGFQGDPASAAGRQSLWQLAQDVLPRKRAGDFNQALMELGGQVCQPRSALCDACPVELLCAARVLGLVDSIPRPPNKRTKIEAVREAAVVVWRHDKVLLRQPTKDERWAGLWDFPRFPLQARRGNALRQELVKQVDRLSGIVIEPGERLTTLTHSVTRYRITLQCYQGRYLGTGNDRANRDNADRDNADRDNASRAPQRWIRPSQLADVPLNVTGRKIGQLLCERTAAPKRG